MKSDVSQHWGQEQSVTNDIQIVDQNIQIYSFLWYSLQHLKLRGCLPVDIEERRWKSSEQIRETLIANPLQIHWASKQVSRQSLKQRRATEIISGSLLVLLILLHSFTETSWFHRKGKNFEFHHLPIKSLSACLKSSDHTQWSDETRHLKILFRKSQLSTKVNQIQRMQNIEKVVHTLVYWCRTYHQEIPRFEFCIQTPSYHFQADKVFDLFEIFSIIIPARIICMYANPTPALQYGSELNLQCWFETHRLVWGRHIF